ncbi:MAG: hypothetical protein AAGA23_00030 [Pseudomonadota bacterium]
MVGENVISANYLANRVHALGREARSTANERSRARLYGQLFSTCTESKVMVT